MIARDKVKDVLITRTAIKTLTPESVVEKVVSFQAKDAARAIKIYSEVEFSGFGKFYISISKLEKRIKRLSSTLERMEKRDEALVNIKRLNETKEALNILKTKLNELKADDTRVEEQPDTTRTLEEADKGNI